MDFMNTLHLGASRVLDQAPLRRARSTFLQRSHSPSKPRRRASPGIGCRANAKGTPATKGERDSAPTHLPEEEAVVEIVQAEAEATRTSANDRTGAVATRVVAVTGISASARRDVIPGGTGMRNVPGQWRGVAISCGERCVAFTFPGVDWVCTSMTVEVRTF